MTSIVGQLLLKMVSELMEVIPSTVHTASRLRVGLHMGITPRSCQGQISQKGSEYLVFLVFASIVLI